MRKVLSYAVGLCAALAIPAAASAQSASQLTPVQYYPPPPPIFECRAENGYGSWGLGRGPTAPDACHIAKSYCAQNAPVGTVCYAIWVIRIQ